MDIGRIVERAKNMLTSPKTEWPVVAAEATSTAELYKNYVLVLAAIPAVAGFIGLTLTGFGIFRLGVGTALGTAILGYLMSLGLVYVYGLVINALAPTFGAQKDAIQALKTAAYASTAAWVCGIGAIIPGLGFLLTLVGAIWTAYLLYLGLPHTMKAPADKTVGYTIVSIIVGIVLTWIVSVVVGGITGAALVGGGMLGGSRAPAVTLPGSRPSDGEPQGSLDKLEKWGKQVEDAGRKLEAAERSGDARAQQEALGGMLGAVLGGAGVTAVDSLSTEVMKSFIPETLAGLPRRSITAERNQAMGIQISEGTASYGAAGGPQLRLEIRDTGGARGVMMFAGWAAIESERETDTGYEKTYRDGARMVHEQWDSSSKSGEFSLILGERFVAKVAGEAASIEQLRAALRELDLARLEALRNEGVKSQ